MDTTKNLKKIFTTEYACRCEEECGVRCEDCQGGWYDCLASDLGVTIDEWFFREGRKAMKELTEDEVEAGATMELHIKTSGIPHHRLAEFKGEVFDCEGDLTLWEDGNDEIVVESQEGYLPDCYEEGYEEYELEVLRFISSADSWVDGDTFVFEIGFDYRYEKDGWRVSPREYYRLMEMLLPYNPDEESCDNEDDVWRDGYESEEAFWESNGI